MCPYFVPAPLVVHHRRPVQRYRFIGDYYAKGEVLPRKRRKLAARRGAGGEGEGEGGEREADVEEGEVEEEEEEEADQLE